MGDKTMTIERTEEERKQSAEFVWNAITNFHQFVQHKIPFKENDPDNARNRVILISELIANFVCSTVRGFSAKNDESAFPSNMLDILSEISVCATQINHTMHDCCEGDLH